MAIFNNIKVRIKSDMHELKMAFKYDGSFCAKFYSYCFRIAIGIIIMIVIFANWPR